jgi:hypothetical protein
MAGTAKIMNVNNPTVAKSVKNAFAFAQPTNAPAAHPAVARMACIATHAVATSTMIAQRSELGNLDTAAHTSALCLGVLSQYT